MCLLKSVNKIQICVCWSGRIMDDIEQAYRELEGKHGDHVEILNSEDEDDKVAIAAVCNDMYGMYREFCKVQAMYLERKSVSKYVGDNKSKLENPTFSGDIRDYPTFRKDYENHMIPSFGQDPFALRSCLSGKALQAIQGLHDNFEEMMNRLDAKYGCKEKLVDAILIDISRMKRVPDGDYAKFTKMIEVVERLWLDLQSMNIEVEMNTSVVTN